MTLKEQMQQIENGNCVDSRVKLSAYANEMIEEYQKAYQDHVGSKVSKAYVICQLIYYAEDDLRQETARHERYARERHRL